MSPIFWHRLPGHQANTSNPTTVCGVSYLHLYEDAETFRKFKRLEIYIKNYIYMAFVDN